MKLFAVFILLVVYATGEEDYKELPNTALGGFSNVLETKMLPFGQRLSSNSIKAGFSLTSIITQVMKGQVDPSDKLVLAVKNISDVFKSKFDELNAAIVAESNSIVEEILVTQLIHDLDVNGKLLVSNGMDLLKYNASVDEIRAFKTFCEVSNSDPKKLVLELAVKLINPCNRTLSPEQLSRFSTTLQLLNDHNLEFKWKTSLAYYSAFQTHESVEELIFRFNSMLEDTNNVKDVIRKLNGPDNQYEPTCLFESVFYGKGCDKKKLIDFISVTSNLMKPIIFGSIICGSVRFEDEERRLAFLEEIEGKLDSFLEFQETFYKHTLIQAFHTCEPSWINNTIKEFKPAGKIDATNYDILGKDILNMLIENGDSEQLRHVVVSKNLELSTKYFAVCPDGRCKVILNPPREIAIFYSTHNASDGKIQKNKQFFNESASDIEKIIHAKSSELYIDNVRQALIKANLSLTSADRFGVELWVREWASIGDCQLSTTLSWNGNVKNFEYHSYYYRNPLSTSACEDYDVYVMP